MEEDLVTYKQAIALQEIKYDQVSWFSNIASLYNKEGKHTMYTNYGRMGSGTSDGYISAPLKTHVFRWFRKKYNLYHRIDPGSHDNLGFYLGATLTNSLSIKTFLVGVYTDYNEAESACIDKLIELVKQQQDGTI